MSDVQALCLYKWFKKEITVPKSSPAPVFCAYKYPDLSTWVEWLI